MFRASPPISEQVYEPDHPNVAIDVHNLGLVLLDLGDFKEARKCFERALKIDEQVYGPDHPNVAIRVNNLGGVLRDLGDLQEARKRISSNAWKELSKPHFILFNLFIELNALLFVKSVLWYFSMS